jgi:hypothetical protein
LSRSSSRIVIVIRSVAVIAGLRLRIPRQSERGFQSKPNAISTAKRTLIPRQTERTFHA